MNKIARSSVNAKTIAYYNKLSSIWWQFQTLQELNRTIFSILENDLTKDNRSDSSKPLSNMRIIDIGCGGGIVSEKLAKLGGTVMGIDPAADLIKVAQEHAKLDTGLRNLTYKVESVEEHALNNSAKYDIALATSVLYHMHDKETLLENCAKCIKPGGTFWVSMINKTWTSWFETKYLELCLKVVPRGLFHWEMFMSLEDLIEMLTKYNFKTVSIFGIPYNPFRNAFLCNKNVSGTFLLKCVKS